MEAVDALDLAHGGVATGTPGPSGGKKKAKSKQEEEEQKLQQHRDARPYDEEQRLIQERARISAAEKQAQFSADAVTGTGTVLADQKRKSSVVMSRGNFFAQVSRRRSQRERERKKELEEAEGCGGCSIL